MESICRICNRSTGDFLDIFTKYQLPKIESSIADMIIECFSCDIKKNDKLPMKICLSCFSDTQTAFIFKRKWEENHKSLTLKMEKQETDAFIDSLESEDWQLLNTEVKIEHK